MKRQYLPAMCLVLSAWLCGASQTLHAMTVADDSGRVISLEHVPARIVSLLPSLTETVCALGACQRLVGVDVYSNYPTSVRALPQLGGGLNPNVEALVALKPDLVLLATSSPAISRLRSLGLNVVALEPQNHADVRRVILTLGQLLAAPQAPQLWQSIDASMQSAAQALPPSARALKVYFEVNSAPYAAGESSFIGETLLRLGAKNMVPASMGPFPKLNPEFVVRAAPDLIMVGDSDPAAFGTRPGWQRIPAVRKQQVCVFGRADSDVLVRPGPRMAEGAQLMAACLRKFAP